MSAANLFDQLEHLRKLAEHLRELAEHKVISAWCFFIARQSE